MVAKYREWKEIEKGLLGTKQMLVEAEDAELKQLAHDEERELEARRETVERELKFLMLPKDPNDDKNVILEIRAGTGGDEASLFAGELFRMYSRYAESQGWKLEILESSPSSIGGMKDVVAAIQGKKVYSKLKYESGVHRVQRVPATEQQGRIHTSAATVAVLPEADEIDIKIEAKDLRIDTFCSSGPGGQSVNTTYSAPRGELFLKGVGFGHTGFTGTSIWVNLNSKTAIIILTNRVHPEDKGNVTQLRREIGTAVARAAGIKQN